MPSTEYLDEERKKLWKAVIDLQEAVKNKTSDYERNAQQSSKKTSEFRNRSQESKERIDLILTETEKTLGETRKLKNEIGVLFSTIQEVAIQSEDNASKIEDIKDKGEKLEALFTEYEFIEDKLREFDSIYEKGSTLSTKTNAIHNLLTKRSKEIHEIYYEVAGYEDTNDETDESVHVEGLKDQLERAYDELKKDASSLNNEIAEIKTNSEELLSSFIKGEKEKFDTLVSSWKKEYSSSSEKIKTLLPDALTAGLSHAFSEKRIAEIKEGEKLSKIFNYSILGLVLVSLIPFGINVYLLNIGKSLESIIYDMPRLVSTIFPLYLPLLWVAYSSNRKGNLSKRLVEEYTHKEVLSKTFEGLSSQIESIDDEAMSSELRIKLLYNILDVSSENPGKLISNYNKADHPLMDALEKSTKLSNAVDDLAKIPGLSKITKILEKKSQKILEQEGRKVKEALDVIAPEADKVQPNG